MELFVGVMSALAWTLLGVLFVKAGFLLFLSTRHWRRTTPGQEASAAKGSAAGEPMVSILVPCFNEEATLRNCVESLIAQEYPKFEILLINDGSTDSTQAVAKRLERKYKNAVQLLEKQNGGKASALNHGIDHSSGEIIVCIDADSIFLRDTLSRLVAAFDSKDVGGVGGNVKVANRGRLIAKQQSLEYICGLNLQRRAFAQIECMQVMSGAIGAFRRDALRQIGGYSSDTLVEDMDVTVSLIRAGFRVKYEPRAIAYTEVPESLKDFLVQRYRWIFGGFQVVRKHADMLFKKKYGAMGMIGLPYSLIFPWVDVLVSTLFIWALGRALVLGNMTELFFFYMALILIQFGWSSYALYMEGEMQAAALLSIVEGLWYGPLISFTIVKAAVNFLRGAPAKWNKFSRLGKNVLILKKSV